MESRPVLVGRGPGGLGCPGRPASPLGWYLGEGVGGGRTGKALGPGAGWERIRPRPRPVPQLLRGGHRDTTAEPPHGAAFFQWPGPGGWLGTDAVGRLQMPPPQGPYAW